MAGGSALVLGYDAGASSAALHNLTELDGITGVRHFSAALKGWIVSSRWAGLLAGSVAVYFTPTIRLALVLACVLNGVGGLGTSLAPRVWVLILARIVGGLGDGLSTAVLNQYASEISPPMARGGAIAIQETNFILGALLGSLAGHHWIESPRRWRTIWGITGPMGFAAAAIMATMPDTPRNVFALKLAAAARGELQLDADSGGTGSSAESRSPGLVLLAARVEAERALLYVRGLQESDNALDAEVDAIERSFRDAMADNRDGGEELTLGDIFGSQAHRKLLLAGSVALASSALTGQPAIMSYATQVFTGVGFDTTDASALAVTLYFTKLATTLPDFTWLDTLDRRPLMAAGLSGIGASYALAALATTLHAPRTAATALLAGTMCYQASVGSLSWIIPAEVFTTDMRMIGASVATVVYAASSFVVVQIHPLLQAHGVVFFLVVYTCSTAVARYVTHRVLPETRGQSLEDIAERARSNQLFLQLAADQGEDVEELLPNTA